MKGLIETVGRGTVDTVRKVGGMTVLLKDAAWWTTVAPRRGKGRVRWAETFQQAHRAGVRSLPIVFLVLFFVGMILAIQLAGILERFGVVEYVSSVVSISIFRELGPLLAAIVLSGFVGAAIAAEIGTMKVSEEVMALEAHALDPIRFLVVPRLLGMMLMVPIVTLMADYVGVFGGFLIGITLADIGPYLYIQETWNSLEMKDLVTGLIKAEAFAVVITLIACREGLTVTGGAEGVGRATTGAVVQSIVAVIITDLIFTFIFYFV